MKQFKLTFLAVVAAAGCNSIPAETAINTTPPGASLVVDGQLIGVAPSSHRFAFDDRHPTHEIKTQLEGYIDTQRQITADTPEYRKGSIEIKLPVDEAFTGTVACEASPGPLEIQVNPQLTQDFVWTHVVNEVTLRYKGLQQLEQNSGHIQSEWATQHFSHPVHGSATVRTQFIGNYASKDPLKYNIFMKSEISFGDAPERWTPYPRVLPPDAELVKTIQFQINSMH